MDGTYVKYLAGHEKLAEVDLGRHVSYPFPCDLLSWPDQLKMFTIVLLPVPFFYIFFFRVSDRVLSDSSTEICA